MKRLVGRRAEREAIDRLLLETHSGRSGTLALVGEPGIGKTTLLHHAHAVATSSGYRVERSAGAEPESQFAFGALHQLCNPLMDRIAALPEPQEAALRVAFGLQVGTTPDRFVVGLAVLNLLSESAGEKPLLCIIDDAHWLDQASAQVMAFVARRVTAERLAVLLALRDPTNDGDLRPYAGLPELRLKGLTDSEARTLLADAVATPLEGGVRERIIAEAHGNPLALLDLPRCAPQIGLAGGFELPEDVDVPRRIEDSFRQRSKNLPAETQLLVLLAAAEPTGDAATLRRAAKVLAIETQAAAPAEAARLLKIDNVVRFRHPLVRSAVYQAATPSDRRRVHGALATATDPQSHPDHRAWHRARAVLGTDEGAAAELERSADRARARCGLAAAAAFLHQASELTPDPARRASRALEAAQAKHAAGASNAALSLLKLAEAGPLTALQNARLQLLRARVVLQSTGGPEVLEMLLGAAEAFSPMDAASARQAYLHAMEAAITIGGNVVRKVADAALGAPAPIGPPTPADLLLDGLAATHTLGYEVGVPALRKALEAFRSEASASTASDSDRWLLLASRTAATLFEDELLYALTDRHVRLARRTCALAELPGALTMQSVTHALIGEFARAAELASEGTAIAHAIGTVPLPHAELVLAGWRGDEAGAFAIEAARTQGLGEQLDDTVVSVSNYASAVLQNARRNYGPALTAAARAYETDELTYSNVTLPEIVEAASRASDPVRARAAVEELEMLARAAGTPWALGLAARSRALITDGPDAEQYYLNALDLLKRQRMLSYSARTHLVFGEWLRREGRRHEARDQLRTAHQLLTDMGAEAFAKRAARELLATGEHPRERTTQPLDALTTHELQIARLVATGATSQEVASELFLSRRTIEAHLRNIFRKLDITSRRQLREFQLPEIDETAAPPARRIIRSHDRRKDVVS